MYSMRFDMRAPDFGASPVELYEAAVDMRVGGDAGLPGGGHLRASQFARRLSAYAADSG
jgi:hypothetical protein